MNAAAHEVQSPEAAVPQSGDLARESGVRLHGHDTPLSPGSLIAGKYRVMRVLARGGMGVVYLAEHLALDVPVVVKLIRSELSDSPEAVERFFNEARIMARLKSAHVARVLDFGSASDGSPYLVIEHLEGEDLATRIECSGPLDAQAAADIVLQICEALAEAHAKEVVHRDLKPENIFLTVTPDGSSCAKLLDFGVSKELEPSRQSRRSLTQPGRGVGSPNYMAPEQMRSGNVDPRADIWSLGAVLYEAVTGRQAYAGDSVAQICARVLQTRPAPPTSLCPWLPHRLEAVILRCLARDPGGRFASVAELASALAPFASGDTEAAVRRISRTLRGTPASSIEVPRLLLVSDELEQDLAKVARDSTVAALPADSVKLTRSSIPGLEKRRWPWVVLAGLVLGGAGAALYPQYESELHDLAEGRVIPAPLQASPDPRRSETLSLTISQFAHAAAPADTLVPPAPPSAKDVREWKKQLRAEPESAAHGSAAREPAPARPIPTGPGLEALDPSATLPAELSQPVAD